MNDFEQAKHGLKGEGQDARSKAGVQCLCFSQI